MKNTRILLSILFNSVHLNEGRLVANKFLDDLLACNALAFTLSVVIYELSTSQLHLIKMDYLSVL